MLLSTFILANLVTGAIGAGYMGASVGAKLGRALNRKRLGKYSPFNEIITIRSASEVLEEQWYCRRHKKWNWAGDECNCCDMDGGSE